MYIFLSCFGLLFYFVSLLLQKYKLFSGWFFVPEAVWLYLWQTVSFPCPYSWRFYHFTISEVLQWTSGSRIFTSSLEHCLGPLEPFHQSAERTNIPRSLHLSPPFLPTPAPRAAVNQGLSLHCASFSLETHEASFILHSSSAGSGSCCPLGHLHVTPFWVGFLLAFFSGSLWKCFFNKWSAHKPSF